MPIELSPDLEALIEKRLARGGYRNAEDVIRHALEEQEIVQADLAWSDEDRQALDAKIDRSLEEFAQGNVYGPDEARKKLAEMRVARAANSER